MKNEKKLKCLNCDATVFGNYCNHCSQKTDTNRLDFKHFIKHDIFHGTLHLDKGLPFTLKEIILRPGTVAMDFIKGKRVKYYNFFYISLLLIGLILSIKGFYKQNYPTETTLVQSELQNGITFAQKNLKSIFLLCIPLLVLCSKIVYNKQKLNLSEHSIIAVINVIFFLLFALVSNFIYLLSSILDFKISESISKYFIYLGILSFIRVYYLCFVNDLKSKRMAFFKAFLTAVLFFTFLLITVMIVIFVTN